MSSNQSFELLETTTANPGSGDDASNRHQQAGAMRVLILSHSHPKITRGGAEIAADALARGLRTYHNATTWFLGCSSKSSTARLGATFSQPFSDDDYVYQSNASFDWFKFANRDQDFPVVLSKLLNDLKPDIVHFHHYAQFGVEAFSIVRRILPNAKIVLTLHEFLAICNNYGQMVKTDSFRLCEEENPSACSVCFPQIEARDFFLRKRYIQFFFENIDVFISPSHFLAERYIAWGLPSSKMKVIENIPPSIVSSQRNKTDLTAQKALLEIDNQNAAGPNINFGSMIRVGFFGQMSPLKGILVLLDAARILADWETEIEIKLFGDYSNQPPDFQKAVKERLEDLDQNVTYHGPYDNKQVHNLMQTVDLVIVPSVWWENSPVVIQEAFTNGKPVICSDIGGMAEKVRPGLDGLWFEAGNSKSLAQLLSAVAQKPAVVWSLAASVRKAASMEDTLNAHVEAYTSSKIA